MAFILTHKNRRWIARALSRFTVKRYRPTRHEQLSPLRDYLLPHSYATGVSKEKLETVVRRFPFRFQNITPLMY